MPENPVVLEFRALAEGEPTPQKIVDQGLPAQFHELLDTLKAAGASRLFLAWTGSKIPRGVELPNGEKIGWAQHGILVSEGGNDVGFYDRVEEFGGPNRDRHQMVIHLKS